LVYQFELYFPPGSSGLLHVAVFDGGYQVWPSEPGETFFGDNILVSFPDRYYVDSPQKVLIISSYNTDDTYDHVFQLRLGIVSSETFIASFLPVQTMGELNETVAKLLAEQQATREAQRETLLKYFSGE